MMKDKGFESFPKLHNQVCGCPTPVKKQLLITRANNKKISINLKRVLVPFERSQKELARITDACKNTVANRAKRTTGISDAIKAHRMANAKQRAPL